MMHKSYLNKVIVKCKIYQGKNDVKGGREAGFRERQKEHGVDLLE